MFDSIRFIHTLVLAAALSTLALHAQSPTPTWSPDHVPFTFTYASQPSTTLLPTWQFSQQDLPNQTRRYTYTDPATHLTVTADVRLYPDFPTAIDWVLHFKNNGATDTPILEDILPLAWTTPASHNRAILHHAKGSAAGADDFQPLEESIRPNHPALLASLLGDSSNTLTLPFFNLDTGTQGIIGAIGWTGNWKAGFDYAPDGKTITLTAGMQKTHLLLHPGEEIRTPRIVLMPWSFPPASGDTWQDAQNQWRRLLFAHYTPQQDGHPKPGPIMFGSWGSEPIADKLAYIQWVHDQHIPVQVYAADAGWYGASFGAETDPTNPWWKNRGDWFPSPLYYPHGIKPLGQALKADGFGFSLWMEPETTMPGRKILIDHPQWFTPPNPNVTFQTHGEYLIQLGDPAARAGITDLVSNLISDFGMTWFRQDFNIAPAPSWNALDTPDRIGIAEIGHIEGLYQMWDDLLARHPGLRIDNCASGGRRLDLEMISRSFSIWRTDHGFNDTIAAQAQTQALADWVPQNMGWQTYAATFESSNTPWTHPGPYSTPESLYRMRLAYDTGYGIGPGATGLKNPEWVAWVKQAIHEYREVQPYFYGDFYPILPYSLTEETWTAWQWNRPETSDGLVILLRRPKSPYHSLQLNLRHLDPKATYQVEIRTTYNHAPTQNMKGADLTHLIVKLPEAPSSTLIFYRKQ
jgi:alpha-galactosidase